MDSFAKVQTKTVLFNLMRKVSLQHSSKVYTELGKVDFSRHVHSRDMKKLGVVVYIKSNLEIITLDYLEFF